MISVIPGIHSVEPTEVGQTITHRGHTHGVELTDFTDLQICRCPWPDTRCKVHVSLWSQHIVLFKHVFSLLPLTFALFFLPSARLLTRFPYSLIQIFLMEYNSNLDRDLYQRAVQIQDNVAPSGK